MDERPVEPELRVRQAVAHDLDASRRRVGNALEKRVRMRPPVARVGLGRVLQVEDHEAVRRELGAQVRLVPALSDDVVALFNVLVDVADAASCVAVLVARIWRLARADITSVDACCSLCLEAERLVKGGVGCVDRASVGVFLLPVGLESESEVAHWRTRRSS